MPVTFSKIQVERGRELVMHLNKSKWELGDLGLQITETELAPFAKEIFLTVDRLKKYRTVSTAFPKDVRRADLSWTVHEELLSAEDPTKALHQRKVWTTDTVREFLNKAPAGSRNRRTVTAAERIDIAREVMKDENSAKEVFRDQQTWAPSNRAQAKVIHENHEARVLNFEVKNPELAAEWASQDEITAREGHALEAEALIGHARLDLIRAAEHWSKASGYTFDEVTLGQLDTISAAALGLKETSGVTLDSALNSILNENR